MVFFIRHTIGVHLSINPLLLSNPKASRAGDILEDIGDPPTLLCSDESNFAVNLTTGCFGATVDVVMTTIEEVNSNSGNDALIHVTLVSFPRLVIRTMYGSVPGPSNVPHECQPGRG